MEFWKRLNGASTITLAVTLATAALAILLDQEAGAEFSLPVVGMWLAVGVVSAVGLAALTMYGERLVGDRLLVERYRAVLVVANVVWIAGLVASTGGSERPYWALMLAPLLIAAVSMSRLRSLLIGVIASLATVIAVLAAGPVGLTDASFLVLILPLGPGVTWFVGMLCAAVWDERRTAGEERDEPSARVDELSSVLAQAAEGDLAVRVDAKESANDSVRALTESFNNTLANLRELVGQVRPAATRSRRTPASCSPPPRSPRPARPSSLAPSPRRRRRSRSWPRPRRRSRRRRSGRPAAAETLRLAERAGRPSRPGRGDDADLLARRTRSPPGRSGSASRARRSAGSSTSSTTSPTRPTCWPSTPRSRPRGPASTAAASRWSPPRCASWPSARGGGRRHPEHHRPDPGGDERDDHGQRGRRQGGPRGVALARAVVDALARIYGRRRRDHRRGQGCRSACSPPDLGLHGRGGHAPRAATPSMGFLPKPFTFDALAHKVREALDSARPR